MVHLKAHSEVSATERKVRTKTAIRAKLVGLVPGCPPHADCSQFRFTLKYALCKVMWSILKHLIRWWSHD